jgi:hypothetical protein
MNSLALQLDDESTTARATELADKYREKSKIVETGLVNLMKFIELPDDKDKKFDLKAYEECDKWQKVTDTERQEAEEKAREKAGEKFRKDTKSEIDNISTFSFGVKSRAKDAGEYINLVRMCPGDIRTAKVNVESGIYGNKSYSFGMKSEVTESGEHINIVHIVIIYVVRRTRCALLKKNVRMLGIR